MASIENKIRQGEKIAQARAQEGRIQCLCPSGAHQRVKRCQGGGLRKADSSIDRHYFEPHDRAELSNFGRGPCSHILCNSACPGSYWLPFFFNCLFFVCFLVPCAWAVLSSQRKSVLILDLDLSVLSGETQTCFCYRLTCDSPTMHQICLLDRQHSSSLQQFSYNRRSW